MGVLFPPKVVGSGNNSGKMLFRYAIMHFFAFGTVFYFFNIGCTGKSIDNIRGLRSRQLPVYHNYTTNGGNHEYNTRRNQA